jgi:hypothetical protein
MHTKHDDPRKAIVIVEESRVKKLFVWFVECQRSSVLPIEIGKVYTNLSQEGRQSFETILKVLSSL